MSVVILLHLLLLLPNGFRGVGENAVLVVIGGLGVFDPKILWSDFAVRKLRVLLNGGSISPRSSDIEDSGGGFDVAFLF